MEVNVLKLTSRSLIDLTGECTDGWNIQKGQWCDEIRDEHLARSLSQNDGLGFDRSMEMNVKDRSKQIPALYPVLARVKDRAKKSTSRHGVLFLLVSLESWLRGGLENTKRLRKILSQTLDTGPPKQTIFPENLRFSSFRAVKDQAGWGPSRYGVLELLGSLEI